MADINALVIQIQSDGVEAATKRLNDFGNAADSAEGKVGKLGKSAEDSASKQDKASQALYDSLVAKADKYYASVYDKQVAANNKLYANQQAEANKMNALFEQRAKASAQAFADIGPTRANLDAATASGEKFLANLKAQTDMLGLTAKQMREYQVAALQAKAAQMGVSDSAAGMIKKFEESAVSAGHASSGAAGIGRELLVLGHELSQGQFSRFGGSMIVLAERINFIPALLEKLTEGFAKFNISLAAGLGIIGAVAVALVAMGVAAASAAHDFNLLNNSLIMSGNFAGTTVSGLSDIAKAAASTGGSLASAREIVAAFAETGRFTASQIKLIAPALVDLEHATSAPVDGVTEAFKRIQSAAENTTARSADAVTRAVLEMNSSYHLLTAAQIESIAQLEREGSALSATQLAFEGMANTIHERAEKAAGEFTPLGKALNELKKDAESTWESFKNLFATRMPDVSSQIKEIRDRQSLLVGSGSSVDQAKYQEYEKQITDILEKERTKRIEAEKQGKQQQLDTQQSYNARSLDLAFANNNAKFAAQQKLTKLENDWDEASTEYKLKHQQDYLDAYANLLKATQDKPLKDNREDSSVVQAAVKEQQNLITIAKQSYTEQNRALDEAYKHGDATIEDHYQARRDALGKYTTDVLAAVEKQINIENAALKSGIYDKPSQVTDAQARVKELQTVWLGYANNAVAMNKLMYQKQENDTTAYYDGLASASQKADVVAMDGMKKTLQAQKNHTEEIGKTKEQVETLRALRAQADSEELSAQAEAYQNALDMGLVQGREAEIYQNHLNNLRTEIGLRKDIADEARKGSVAEADAAAAKEAFQSWKDTNRKIGDDLATAIVDGGGKGWKKLLHDMEVAFAKAVLQPILAPISGGISSLLNPEAAQATGSISGVAGSGNSAISLASAAANVYKVVSGGFQSLSTSVAGYVQSAQNALGSSFGGTGAGAGNATGAFANSVGTAAGYAGGVAAGHVIGNVIAGEYQVGNHGQAITNISAIVGAVIGGPIGGAIGGAIGGLVNRLFGMGSMSTTSQGLRGTITDTGTTGESYQNWHQNGGLFRSDKNGTNTQALTSDTINSFTSGLTSLKAASSDFAKNLGISTDSLNNYSKAFDIALTSDATKNQQAITDFFTTMGDDMATKLVPNIADFAKNGEVASATLQRLSETFTATNQIAAILGRSVESVFGSLGLSSDAARERLVDLAGGLDKLTSKTAAYAAAYLTDAEKLAPVQKAVNDAMTSLGQTGITTKDQFKALVNSLDLTNASQATLFNSLMDLAPAFATVADATDAATKATADLTSKSLAMQLQIYTLEGSTVKAAEVVAAQRKIEIAALDASLRPMQERINALTDEKAAADALLAKNKELSDKAMSNADNALSRLKASVDAQKQIVTNSYAAQIKAVQDATTVQLKAANDVKTAITSVFNSVNSALNTVKNNSFVLTEQNRAEAVATLKNAKGSGDLSNIQGALTNIAKPSEDLYTSFVDYARDQAKNTNLLEDIQSQAQGQMDAAQSAVDAINASSTAQITALEAARDSQLSALDNLYNEAVAQLDALKGIDNSILSLSAALASFKGAVAGVSGTTTQQTNGTDAALTKLYKDLLGRTPDAGGFAFWQGRAAAGDSISSIANSIALSDEYKSLHPSLAVGTNFLPKDMTINAHAGERVIPAADNAEIIRRLGDDSSSGSSNAEVVAAVNSLKDVMVSGDVANVQMTRELFKLIRKWDNDGTPETRDVSAVSG